MITLFSRCGLHVRDATAAKSQQSPKIKKTIDCINPFHSHGLFIHTIKPVLNGHSIKLEDLKVLKGSPDLLGNVKIGQGQLKLITETYFGFTIYRGCGHFGQVT